MPLRSRRTSTPPPPADEPATTALLEEGPAPIPATAAAVFVSVLGAVVGLLALGFDPTLALGIVASAGAIAVGLTRRLTPGPTAPVASDVEPPCS